MKRYGGRAVVDDLSFSVERGEVFALLGPNGAGKTTTVEILEGYRHADQGTVRVFDLDPWRDGARLKSRTGLMLQQGGVYPQITTREALRLFAALYPRALDPEQLLDELDLREVARTRYRHLSGGQKQRLSLALAIVGQPELVFLDEPTAAMDPQARRATWRLIRGLHERGATVLLTTHFMDEAEYLADRVAIIDRGQLVALDTPGRLRQASRHEVRLATDPPVTAELIARALGVPVDAVTSVEGQHTAQLRLTPPLLVRLAAHLAEEGVLLTHLEAGSRSLEQAFLSLMAGNRPAA